MEGDHSFFLKDASCSAPVSQLLSLIFFSPHVDGIYCICTWMTKIKPLLSQCGLTDIFSWNTCHLSSFPEMPLLVPPESEFEFFELHDITRSLHTVSWQT